MAFIKSTYENCESYRQEVNAGENWQGITNNWDTPQEIEGDWYIALNPKYPTELELVESKPTNEDEFI